jgi:hypothetical protein
VNADVVADRVADVSANSLASRESAHCNRSLDRGSRYNVAYLCDSPAEEPTSTAQMRNRWWQQQLKMERKNLPVYCSPERGPDQKIGQIATGRQLFC